MYVTLMESENRNKNVHDTSFILSEYLDEEVTLHIQFEGWGYHHVRSNLQLELTVNL